MARELFRFCLEFKIRIIIAWVPQEENAIADEISKWLVPDDFLSPEDISTCLTIVGVHILATYFSSNENNLCSKFFSLHWCRGTSGINCFGFNWGVDNWRIHLSF